MFFTEIWFQLKPNVPRTREISVYDAKLMFTPRFRHIRWVSRERSNEGMLFTLIASYKSDKSARLPETFSIGSLPWPIPKYTYFIYERRETLSLRGTFPPGLNIIDKCLFPGLCRRRRYALRSKCRPFRYAQYLRLARDLSLRRGGSSEKEPGLNGYIAGFLAEPDASICMRRRERRTARGEDSKATRSKTFRIASRSRRTRGKERKGEKTSLWLYIYDQHRHFTHKICTEICIRYV